MLAAKLVKASAPYRGQNRQNRQDDGKGGLRLRGVAFMTVLAVLDSTLPSFCLSYKIQHNEATVAVLTVLAVSAVVAVSVVAATPLKPNPPFSSSWNREKRVSGSKNSHFPVPQKWVLWAKKSPFSFWSHVEKWGFFGSKRPFLGHWETGVFWPRNPLFPILAILTLVGCGRFHNAKLPNNSDLNSAVDFCILNFRLPLTSRPMKRRTLSQRPKH